MKNRTYTYLSLSLLAVAISCGAPDKKAELEKLKSEQTTLAEKIKTLEEEIKKTDTSAGAATKYIVVGFEQVKKKPFTHYLQIQGKIDSDKNVEISSSVGGSVDQVYVVKGQQVQKGALLAKTDGDQLMKGIQEVDKQLELLNQLYDKQKRLWDQQIGTEVQYLNAKNQKEAAESRKATLQEQYSKTSIRAPFSGVIDEVYTKEGQMLAPGMPAFRLVNTGDLKLVAAVSESYVSKVKVNQEAIVTFPDINKEIKTRVKVVGDVIDPTNRTFQVDLDLKQDKNLLKANMISYIKIKDYSNPAVIVIPVNLVQRNNDKNYVYVVDGNISAKRFITLGQYYDNSVEVLDGLKEGEKLITIGYQDLVEGQPIKFE
ncbi:efflux RND transporter periplasmic adaptor subunit [Cytophaga hutchinsonii]|jgi:RND family efflux transporter MFP subunit|uniref:Cation efflux system protein/acriflavin resistance protein B family n=1 Tax=Cytophaga hutchinsonii (strain ATCC 33406 / DSM 1761 / CIP 103989 / NBRC 15051 / NCIMB 9469 / D465) TaxID=269798 RepID=A0A6N4STI7_CYTH3|nr:efflux RND transporter periplasmic adaptor subunit [Cytophaga hutchinsonii]ABG59768.1 cation efflux system protein/acriflavin resistance protein B family [Cytophaga hutchinsonii ATCC 33406]SFX64493.1 RND family efflux transporter, MFP subunit [Cytophaga hutchinsonii ATCC 33406]